MLLALDSCRGSRVPAVTATADVWSSTAQACTRCPAALALHAAHCTADLQWRPDTTQADCAIMAAAA